ncbi:hypothetical protein [uncultured Porphyromonas sp.]|uniref:hypothetical protein n=1 Tax=uncultured Porphyromonas sp. TaxID=159274 RepID=UPI0025947A1B|nr:hypothetical protein [uncultured Porphyromonas sp.]
MKNLLLTLQVTALTLGLCVGCKEKDNKVPPTPTPEIEEDLLSGTYVPSFERVVASFVIEDGKKEEKDHTMEAVKEMWGERAEFGIPASITIDKDSLFIDKRYGLVEKMKVVNSNANQLQQVFEDKTSQIPITVNINANGELELPVTFFHIVYTENYRQFLAQGTSYTMRDESELPKYETGSFYWTHIIVSFKKETSGN